MTSLGRALGALAIAGLIAGLLAATLAATSDHRDDAAITIGVGVPIGWLFVGTGLWAWWRRPRNRFGALLTWVGFAWFLGALTTVDVRLAHSIGLLLAFVYFAAFVHMLLAYPDGRLAGRGERVLLGAVYVLALVGYLPELLLSDLQQTGCECPPSAFQVADAPGLLETANDVLTSLAVLLGAAVIWRALSRWRDAPRFERPALAPVVLAGVALVALAAVQLTSNAVGADSVTEVLGIAGLVPFALTPPLFLVGLLKSRAARAEVLSGLVSRLGEARGSAALQQRLGDALGDPTLRVAYWLDRWVDGDGHAVMLPAEDDPDRAWTPVELDGRRVGALVHRRALLEENGLVPAVAAAAGLAVENERLGAQLRARVEELSESRARLVQAGIAERRRLERDLHDGAQQRLVALSLTLRLAHSRLEQDPAVARELIEGAQQELAVALGELRELARGIHPALLADRGLDSALEALAGRSPVPVELGDLPGERLPPSVEAAAYFVVAEALTNVAKYAHASHATVSVRRDNGAAYVEVADDGVGGADASRGTGLRGLADRLSALDGRLEVSSPPGAGTRLRAEIPV